VICPNCNNELLPGAQFCSRCGARVAPAADQTSQAQAQEAQTYPAQPYQTQAFQQAPVYYPPVFYNRVTRHLQTLGMLWMIYGIWRVLTRLVGLTFMHTFFHSHHEFPFGFAIWPFALSSTLIGLGLSMLTAYGLLHRQSWGRVIAIITAIFALVHPILGTALGIYTLWVLAPSASGVEYNTLTTAAPSAPAPSI
jgi:hypothetical protein